MKKLICVLLCAVVILFPLCSCGDKDPDGVSPSDASSGSDWLEVKFAQAEELYSWFTGCGRPSCDTADRKEHSEAGYARVTESGLGSMDDLRGRVGSYFTPEVTDELMQTEVYGGVPMFREFDGRLYYCTEALGLVPSDIGERTGMVTNRTDIELVYHMDITYKYFESDFSASYDYRLELGEDSKWYFADFKLPAMLIAEQMFLSDEG